MSSWLILHRKLVFSLSTSLIGLVCTKTMVLKIPWALGVVRLRYHMSQAQWNFENIGQTIPPSHNVKKREDYLQSTPEHGRFTEDNI